MIHGIDPRTRAQAEHWERKARTNDRIGLAAKTILVALAAAVALAVIL